jgi:phosphate transport system substrate-binding protein
MRSTKCFFLVLTLTAGPVFAGVSLKGTGSYSTGPLFGKWMEEYHSLHPELKLKYETRNSTDGINQWLGRGADFTSTDAPLSATQERKAIGRAVLRLPIAIVAVAITYNIPGVPSGLKLSPKTLSELFMGSIKKWNDPAIRELNPGISLPNMDVLVLNRQEESTLQDLFPGYLAHLDAKWTLKREKDKSLKWVVGPKVKGNEKVLEKMRRWPGVIAAVDYPFAVQNHLPVAELKNQEGHFVAPTGESLEAAASDFLSLPDDFLVVLGHSRSKEAYPLCGFSWLLVYQDYFRAYHDHSRGQALVGFLNWILGDGRKLEGDLDYVPLPESFLPQVQQAVAGIKY